jgi:hypothetical protein
MRGLAQFRSFPARDVQDRDIFRPMIIMRTKNQLPRFRDALGFSTLLLLLPAVYPAQQVDRYLLSPPALQAGLLIDVEPQPGPQLPCGKDPMPAYPGVDELAIVKSWSKSDLRRE